MCQRTVSFVALPCSVDPTQAGSGVGAGVGVGGSLGKCRGLHLPDAPRSPSYAGGQPCLESSCFPSDKGGQRRSGATAKGVPLAAANLYAMPRRPVSPTAPDCSALTDRM